jgi:dienelactone hydrolase
MHQQALSFEVCEDRTLPSTLVFILNGNAYSAANPSALTANAACVLNHAGARTVQIANPTMNTPGAFRVLESQIGRMSHGQPIGIVGFSAGGTLALRLATDKALHVKSALDYYGPPDVNDYFAYHESDYFAQYVMGHVHFTKAGLNTLSGPINTTAHLVAAFGRNDVNVVASVSEASLQKDAPDTSVYTYPGPHGVGITACPTALDEFVACL